MKINTLFCGTSEFAVPILQKLLTLEYIDLVGIVTQPDKPVGRKQILTPPPVKSAVLFHKNYEAQVVNSQLSNVKLFQPESLKVEAESILKETNPELIIVASYGQFIPKLMLDYPKYRCLNIHGSLLPDFRGAVPIQMAILKGYKETGVSIQIMSEKMDAGDLLGSEKCEVSSGETYGTLTSKLSNLAAGLLENILPQWLSGEIIPQKQNNTKATYCYIKDTSKASAEINWHKPAAEIERMIRAFNPSPVAWFYCTVNDRQVRIKLYEAKIAEKIDPAKEIGKIYKSGKSLLVNCNSGALELLSLQVEGKERKSAHDYLYLAV